MTNYQETLITNPLVDQLRNEKSTIDHVQVIQSVISTLDQDNSAMVSQDGEDAYLWKFKYGSVLVFVQLNGTSDEDTITVWSAVLKLPVKDETKLMRRLLESNCTSTFEARYGIIENQVVVISTRTLAELSPREVSRIITIVATIADDNDELLASEFASV
jgi:hypothetical protein